MGASVCFHWESSDQLPVPSPWKLTEEIIEWSLSSSHGPSPGPHPEAEAGTGLLFAASISPQVHAHLVRISKAGFPYCANLLWAKLPHTQPVPVRWPSIVTPGPQLGPGSYIPITHQPRRGKGQALSDIQRPQI